MEAFSFEAWLRENGHDRMALWGDELAALREQFEAEQRAKEITEPQTWRLKLKYRTGAAR